MIEAHAWASIFSQRVTGLMGMVVLGERRRVSLPCIVGIEREANDRRSGSERRAGPWGRPGRRRRRSVPKHPRVYGTDCFAAAAAGCLNWFS